MMRRNVAGSEDCALSGAALKRRSIAATANIAKPEGPKPGRGTENTRALQEIARLADVRFRLPIAERILPPEAAKK